MFIESSKSMVGRTAQMLHMASANLLMSYGDMGPLHWEAGQISIIKTLGLNSARLVERHLQYDTHHRYLRIREFAFVASECSHLYQFF